MKAHQTRAPISGTPWIILSLPVVVLAAAATAWVYFGDSAGEEFALDADLCPTAGEASVGKAFLVDLTKPIDPDRRSLPQELLGGVIDELERDAELRVYLLNGSADAPRTELGRLCKPFANADINMTTKDHGGAAMRSCDELPAQLTPELRGLATGFCALGEGLEGSLAQAVQEAARRTETRGSHLIEALEDLRIEMAERPAPQTLYVFSDMMQHAAWFSHLDLPWQEWSHAELARLREEQGWPSVPAGQGGMRVELFYLPRTGSTDQPRIHRSHQRFWREYFADASVTFHDQAPMREYRATALMGIPTAAELADMARRGAEDLLLQVREEQQRVQQEQERIRAERERIEEEREKLLTAQAGLEQEQQAERRRQEQLAERPQADASPSEAAAPSERETAPGFGSAAASQPTALAREPAASEDSPPETIPDSVPAIQTPSPEVAQTPELAAADAGASPVPEPLPAQVACAIDLTPAAAELTPAYPRGGRTNFGEASIAIRYVVNEGGETVDSEVRMVPGESDVQRRRFSDLFVQSAAAVVRQWTFDVNGACDFPVERVTTFQFSYW